MPRPAIAIQAIDALNDLPTDDNQMAHEIADQILCDVLRHEGYDDVVDAFCKAKDDIGFWYA